MSGGIMDQRFTREGGHEIQVLVNGVPTWRRAREETIGWRKEDVGISTYVRLVPELLEGEWLAEAADGRFWVEGGAEK